MKLEVGKKYRTRDGRRVKVLETDGCDLGLGKLGDLWPVKVIIVGSPLYEYYYVTSDGFYYSSDERDSMDLVQEIAPLTYADVVRKLHRMLDKAEFNADKELGLELSLLELTKRVQGRFKGRK